MHRDGGVRRGGEEEEKERRRKKGGGSVGVQAECSRGRRKVAVVLRAVEAEILASSWPLPSIQNKIDVSATFYNGREELQGKKRKRRKGTVGGAACVDGCASEEEQKEKEEECVQAGGGAGEEVEEEERNALGGWLMEIRGAAVER
ncbi:hypothetical protein AAC387_Pa03g4060 [Persea americana]